MEIIKKFLKQQTFWSLASMFLFSYAGFFIIYGIFVKPEIFYYLYWGAFLALAGLVYMNRHTIEKLKELQKWK